MIKIISLCSVCITAGIRIETDDQGSPTETAPLCQADEYQKDAIMIKCAGGSGSEKLKLNNGKTTSIAVIPKSADGLSIKLTAAADLDIKLWDAGKDGRCIYGYGCRYASKVSNIYENMSVSFSGDKIRPPVSEWVKIVGKTTVDLNLEVRAYATTEGTITYSYGSIGLCASPKPNCEQCENYGCQKGEKPSCDGSTAVSCVAEKCDENQRVHGNSCVACPGGTINAAGDDASGTDTTCDAIKCSANEHVVGHSCDTCPAGTENAAGDDASGTDSTCDAIKCMANQHVVAHACTACPAGTEHSAGGDASGGDTTCGAVHCSRNQYVKSHACNACPAGTTNAAGDDASGADTSCDSTKCGKNEKVWSNECRGCPAGKSNAKGDDASKGNSLCDAIKCAENQHVHDNACIACPAGTKNKAGDDASGANTVCDAIKCDKNQYVRSNACVSCASKSINPNEDDASGPDTKCIMPTPAPTPRPPPYCRCRCRNSKRGKCYNPSDGLRWVSNGVNCAGWSGPGQQAKCRQRKPWLSSSSICAC